MMSDVGGKENKDPTKDVGKYRVQFRAGIFWYCMCSADAPARYLRGGQHDYLCYRGSWEQQEKTENAGQRRPAHTTASAELSLRVPVTLAARDVSR